MVDHFQIRRGDSLPDLFLAAGEGSKDDAILSWLHEPDATKKPTTLDDLSSGTLTFKMWRKDRTIDEATDFTGVSDLTEADANVRVSFTTAETAALVPGLYNAILEHFDTPDMRTYSVCTSMLLEVCETTCVAAGGPPGGGPPG